MGAFGSSFEDAGVELVEPELAEPELPELRRNVGAPESSDEDDDDDEEDARGETEPVELACDVAGRRLTVLLDVALSESVFVMVGGTDDPVLREI